MSRPYAPRREEPRVVITVSLAIEGERMVREAARLENVSRNFFVARAAIRAARAVVRRVRIKKEGAA